MRFFLNPHAGPLWNSQLKIWNPWNFTMESIPKYSFPFRLMWYTFLNRNRSELLWFNWYCLRNEGFQTFEYEFGQMFLFLCQKKSPVKIQPNYVIPGNIGYFRSSWYERTFVKNLTNLSVRASIGCSNAFVTIRLGYRALLQNWR